MKKMKEKWFLMKFVVEDGVICVKTKNSKTGEVRETKLSSDKIAKLYTKEIVPPGED